MDLVGEFVCMLMEYTFCIPIKNKSAEEMVTAWRNHIAFPFRVGRKLLTDNGTEFKKDLFSRVTKELRVEKKCIHLCTGLNQMDTFKDFTNSSKVV